MTWPVDLDIRCLDCDGRMIITRAVDGELVVTCLDCGATDPIEEKIDDLIPVVP